jgi:AcrR family transcriptional regulator
MSIVSTSRRLGAQASKAAAIDAAHALLLSEGASSVTLQAIAKRVGRTHANLLHHFGSAAGLQRALAERIADRVGESIRAAIASRRQGKASPRDVVDAIFDAFERERAGELIGWIALTRQREALIPLGDTIRTILADFRAHDDPRPMDRITLGLTLLALGDSLIGEELALATGLDRNIVREEAAEVIAGLAAPEH